MDSPAIRRLMREQDGLVSRSQAQSLGATPSDIRRLLRRRQWARVHPGVFVDHTGPLTWRQRAWAAVLYAAPAALCAESALRAWNGPGRRDHDDRIARRPLLQSVLVDVAAGACSALEHAYLTRVERPHGLPRAGRQVRASNRGPIYRDVLYEKLGTVVELDGRLDHTRARDRDRDLERDLDAAIEELLTVRLGWGQVVGRSCLTATKVARVLQRRGWRGSLRPCPECLRIPAGLNGASGVFADGGDFGSPGDTRSTRSA